MHGEEFFLFLYLLHQAERFFFSEHISDLMIFLSTTIGLVLLACLLSIGFASRAVYERRSTVVVDVKLTAYRARLTTHSDRDETFLAARKHLIEEQGKRKYFYREFPLVFVGSEGDRGDPMRSEKRVRKVRSMMDLMLVERGARYGAIPNSVDWNELIVNAMLDFSEEEEERTKNAYQREENVIKLCELKRAIESSLGYEEGRRKKSAS